VSTLSRRSLVAIVLITLTVTAPAAQSRVTQLNESGWKALQGRQPDVAARLFAEALVLRPNDPTLMFGAGAAAYMQGRLADATWRLRRVLELDPAMTEASRLLGEVTYGSGDIDGAIAIYEKAVKYAPKDADLHAKLAGWRKDTARHGTFTERRDQMFTVLYEGRQEEATAVKATDILRTAYRKITARLGAQPANSIYVVLYTERQFRDFTGSPDWAAGVYDGRIRVQTAGALKDPVSFERVLTHELAHAVIWGLAPRGVPAWLHEGMAQYFAGSDVQGARRRVKAQGSPVVLKDLEGTFASKTATEARFAYDASLAAASLVIDRSGFGWGTFFSDLAEGEVCESALIRRFGLSYADLEASLAR
jgi:tetratricopeptide (TPR) repeat protein